MGQILGGSMLQASPLCEVCNWRGRDSVGMGETVEGVDGNESLILGFRSPCQGHLEIQI